MEPNVQTQRAGPFISVYWLFRWAPLWGRVHYETQRGQNHLLKQTVSYLLAPVGSRSVNEKLFGSIRSSCDHDRTAKQS
ncbi:MAG: hypothetical protein ACKER6_01100 [Candidatus Hodgkinia cicadicola]